MKERLVKIAEEMQEKGISNQENNNGNNKDQENNKSDFGTDDVAGFLSSIQQSEKPAKQHYDMNSFAWVGTFHSMFLKILKQDIEKLEMKYNKNF